MKNSTRVSIFMCAMMLATGCAIEMEEPTDHGQHEQNEPFAQEEANDNFVSATCDAGYHLHEIDWSATAFCGDGACCHTVTMYYEHKFCMRNTNDGVSCSDGWWVNGYRFDASQPGGREYGYLKIQALNGH